MIEEGDFRYLVFNSHRTVTDREPLEGKYLSMDAPPEIKKANIQIVNKRQEQAFDIVAVPKDESRPIEVRIDYLSASTDPRPDDVLQLIRFELRRVLELATLPIINPINLFPAIKNIYENKKEGRITDLDSHVRPAPGDGRSWS